MNEYIGNLLIKRFMKKRQCLYHRHDKIQDIIALNPQHPILKKLDPAIYNILREGGSLTNISYNRFIIPTQSKILLTNTVTSKLIRSLNNPHQALHPKIIEFPVNEGLKKLGKNIKRLTNTKLKSIILRAIHGDIYCGTRLKKFGMKDTDECQRCGCPESIKHMLLECDYVKKIWEICRKLTSIPTNNINEVLGLHDFHDKTTLTIHSEIIRRLLAIERPVTNQVKLVKSVIDRLATVETGISKHIIKSLQSQLAATYPIHYGVG